MLKPIQKTVWRNRFRLVTLNKNTFKYPLMSLWQSGTKLIKTALRPQSLKLSLVFSGPRCSWVLNTIKLLLEVQCHLFNFL